MQKSKTPIERIGVGANLEPTAVSGAYLHREKKHDWRSLGSVSSIGEIARVLITVEHELLSCPPKKQLCSLTAGRDAREILVCAERDGRIEPERKRLHEVFAIAHPHISHAPDGGDSWRERLGDRQSHTQRARVIVAISARNHSENRTLGPRGFDKTLERLRE